MIKRLVAVAALLSLCFTSAISTAKDSDTIMQDELVRRTQELFDAVAIGDQGPWKQYYADDALYFDRRVEAWISRRWFRHYSLA